MFVLANKVLRHMVGIPMETNCAPFIADCFDTQLWISINNLFKQTSISLFNSNPKYLDYVDNSNFLMIVKFISGNTH